MEIETEVEPPLPDEDEDDGCGDAMLHMAVWIREGDATRRAASTAFEADVADEQLADGLVRAVLSAAGTRSPELEQLVRHRMRDEVSMANHHLAPGADSGSSPVQREPVAIADTVKAIASIAAMLGWTVDSTITSTITTVLSGIVFLAASVWGRGKVTPTARPRDTAGQSLTPAGDQQ